MEDDSGGVAYVTQAVLTLTRGEAAHWIGNVPLDEETGTWVR